MRSLQLLFLALLFSSCFSTQSFQKQGKKYVAALSSSDFHGRGYTHNGLQKAQYFLQKQFKQKHLIPVYPNYLQKVTYDINIIDSVSLTIQNKELIFGKDYLISADAPSVSFQGSIGDNFPILDSVPPTSVRNELFYTKDLSIIGIKTKKLTHTLSTTQSDKAILYLNDSLKITHHSPIDIRVNSRLQKDFETFNIVGKLKGKTDSAIFITAHYDHLGQVNDAVFPGANDNASGVAMLLNLADYFHRHTPHYTLYFYAFTGEEAGLWGARQAVKDLPIAQEKIKLVINLDILGTGEEGITVVNGKKFPQWIEKLNQINDEKRLLPQIKVRGKACISDHCLFDLKEIPAIYLYTLGGTKAYHDIYDQGSQLPLTRFNEVGELLVSFIESL